ncbi:hypothetical protein VKS41_002335 [Umbelopsis sp. WA50703]|jgi:hypothetical protein
MLSTATRVSVRTSLPLARRSIFYQVAQMDVATPHPPAVPSTDIQAHLDSIETHITNVKKSLETPDMAIGSSAIQLRRLLHLLDSSASEIRELTHHPARR